MEKTWAEGSSRQKKKQEEGAARVESLVDKTQHPMKGKGTRRLSQWWVQKGTGECKHVDN